METTLARKKWFVPFRMHIWHLTSFPSKDVHTFSMPINNQLSTDDSPFSFSTCCHISFLYIFHVSSNCYCLLKRLFIQQHSAAFALRTKSDVKEHDTKYCKAHFLLQCLASCTGICHYAYISLIYSYFLIASFHAFYICFFNLVSINKNTTMP